MDNNLDLVCKPVDTSLAEEYMKTKDTYWPIGYMNSHEDSHNKLLDKCNNKIIYLEEYYSEAVCVNIKPVDYLLLAEKLKNQTNVICQLEYMLRGIPINESKTCMELIIQHFIYWSTSTYTKEFCNNYVIYFDNSSSLLVLGDVPPYLLRMPVTIRAAKNVAVVAHLFTSICNEFGANIQLNFVEDLLDKTVNRHDGGCIGVVTEHSDMESAIDAFKDSPAKVPWKLNKILVQECVYEEFKQTMESRFVKNPDIGGDFLTSSSVGFLVKPEKKMFLIDCVDHDVKVDDDNLQIITVESYRTVKELISMLETSDVYNSSFCRYVSLWSSVMSESYEIAFNIPTRVVWINDYGTFYGPPRISRAVFQLKQTVSHPVRVNTSTFEELQNNSAAWQKLSVEERKSRIKNSMIKLIGKEVNQEIAAEAHAVLNLTIGAHPNNFFHIDKGRTCIGMVSVPQNIGLFKDDHINFTECVQLLFYGPSVVLEKPVTYNQKVILKTLEAIGVPILYDVSINSSETDVQSVPAQVYLDAYLDFKIILSNYGTIFSN